MVMVVKIYDKVYDLSYFIPIIYLSDMMFPFLQQEQPLSTSHQDIMRISPTIMGCGFVRKLNACDVVNYFNGENYGK